jgi:thymidylate synthase (FAD)
VKTAARQVHLLGWTQVDVPLMRAVTGDEWEPDRAHGGELLAEFAGRACYESWSKPNPATSSNVGYLRHILDVGHGSVLEHGTVTFYITGITRACSHELIRHRHFSYSQLSQRYVNADGVVVENDLIASDPHASEIFNRAMEHADRAYTDLADRLDEILADRPASTGRRKAARQAARLVMPNAAETRIVVTGNYRAWRHFIDMRATEHADVEIRGLAIDVLRQLQHLAPNVFGDYAIVSLDDETEVATSLLGGSPG